jgi:hypothetical protein
MTDLERAQRNLVDARQTLKVALQYVEHVKRELPKCGARRKKWFRPWSQPSPAGDFRSALLAGVESLHKPLDEGDLRLLAALLCVADLAEKERKAEFDLQVAQIPCAQRGDDVNQDLNRA